MIEKILLDYLTQKLQVDCGMERPANAPASFVVLEKTGESCANQIPTAILAVQSYGETLYQAASLNQEVKEAMQAAAALPEIAAVRLNSDYNFTDTATKRYRYQAVFDVTYYQSRKE